MQPVSGGGEVSARGMEQPADSQRLAAAARRAVGILRLFHAFVSCAIAEFNLGRMRIWRRLFCGGRTGEYVRSSISSGEIRRGRADDLEEFLQPLARKTTNVDQTHHRLSPRGRR